VTPSTNTARPERILTPFARILRQAVEASPNAVGGAFAASDGEMVDSYATMDQDEWAVLTAHYGIVLSLLNSCFNTWHYGGPEYFIAQHGKLDIVVHAVDAGYFALIAVQKPANLGLALERIRAACKALRKEMA
jgi:predicted regulator of Ras-like GTPase activity (Roadblock/LC7/MglB family)